MHKRLKQNNSQAGANAVEYALVMALVVSIMLAAAQFLNKPIGEFFIQSANCVSSLINGGAACTGESTTRARKSPVTPATITQMSNTGREFLKGIEKLRLLPYDDQTGKTITNWVPGATIGYGYLIPKSEWAKYKNGITKTQAEALFNNGLSAYENAVKNSITVSLKPHQFDALTLLAYNIGVKAYKNSSVVKLINNPKDPTANYPTLEKAWMAFNKSQRKVNRGLINRRKAEYKMFMTGVYKHW